MNSHRTIKRVSILFVAAGVALAAIQAIAMSWTTQVAWKNRPVDALPGWPAGVLEIVNDPQRTDGWNPCFSGWPNDMNHYEFKVAGQSNVNALVVKLAAIKAEKVHVRLKPGREPRAIGFTTVLPEGNGTAVLFSISHKVVYEVSSQSPGASVTHYTNPPSTLPPALTIYTANPAVDLKKLEIPSNVEVSRDYNEKFATEHKDEPGVKAIEEFLEKRPAKAVDKL